MLKSRELFSAALCYLTLAACSGGEPRKTAEPGMFRGDPARDGFYGMADLSGPLSVKWQFKTGGRIYSSAAVDKQAAYFGSEDTRMYAVDLEQGQPVWSFKTGGAVHSSPALADGKLYFGSADGAFYALESSSGKLLWKFETGGEKRYSARGLFGLQPRDEVITDSWDFYLSSPAVENGVVYFGGGDGCLYALDAETGRQNWQFKTGDILHSSPAVAGGKVFFGGWDTYLYALEARTGKELWRFKTGDDPEYHLMTGIQSSPAAAEGRVFFGSRDAHLYALDAETGKPLWNFNTSPTWVVASPAVYQGSVYFGTSDSHLFYALDAASGAKKFEFDAKAFVFSSAAVTGGAVYFGGFNGRLYALDRTSGRELWEFTTEAGRQDRNSILEPDGSFNARAFGNVSTGADMDTAMDRIQSVGSILSSPVVCRGMLLVGSADSCFYALH